MTLSVEDFIDYTLFVKEFNNYNDKIKNTFNREVLLSEQVFQYLKVLNKVKPLKKIICDFDTKSQLVKRWNEMVDNVDVLEDAPVIKMLLNPLVDLCLSENETEIGAFEQFITIVNSGFVESKVGFFEFSETLQQYIGFGMNSWTPYLETFNFSQRQYEPVVFSLI